MAFQDLVRDEDRPFYEELTAWLDAHLPRFREAHARAAYLDTLRDWHRELLAGGWVGITWPRELGGRGGTGTQQVLMDLEFARRRAPASLTAVPVERVGPAIILHGSQEQKDYFLPRLLGGEWVWCQGFSEPDAGSDLANMKTRAERVEGGYRVNGQKTWTSNAFHCDRMWLLARTDPEAPKHRGISAFIVDLKSEGIGVRPIRQMTGERADNPERQFNEVFFEDVFVPAFHRVGEENRGWAIARSTLVRERATNVSSFIRTTSGMIENLAKFPEEPWLKELYEGDMDWFEERMLDFRILHAGLTEIFEQSLEAMLSGQTQGGETSVVKLVASELQQRVTELSLAAAGPYGELLGEGPEVFKKGNAAQGFLRSRATTIGGGTSEIQRNWIAERILGLPKS